MSSHELEVRVRHWREQAGLSQAALAERCGISRQALVAIEAGRQNCSTGIALRLAGALGCSVEALFRLPGPGTFEAREAAAPFPTARALVGRVRERWVAHPVPPSHLAGADAIRVERGRFEALSSPERLERNLLVAGCAPLLGALGERLNARYHDHHLRWLPASSGRALDLLAAGLVHAGGIHYDQDRTGEQSRRMAERFGDQRVLLVNLVSWRQGLVLPPGNPAAVSSIGDLEHSNLRVAWREEGAAARDLLLRELGTDASLEGPTVHGHMEVAGAVATGAADAGVAIEAAAHAFDLSFVPLTEERFDLVMDAEAAETESLARLLATLDDPAFRREAEALAGYTLEHTGEAVTAAAPINEAAAP